MFPFVIVCAVPVSPATSKDDIEPALPAEAAVIRPCASTVILAKEYEPAVTAVLSKSNVTVDTVPVVEIELDSPVPPTISTVSLSSIEALVPVVAPIVQF